MAQEGLGRNKARSIYKCSPAYAYIYVSASPVNNHGAPPAASLDLKLRLQSSPLIAFPTLLGIAADPRLLEARKCERECSFRPHFYSSKENMRHVNLWLLIALLGVGSLLGCSKVYTTAPVSSSIRKPFEVGPETTKGKPSACIKWVRGSGRTSKLLRKAVRISNPAAAAVDREKKLQADNEDHPQ